MSGASPKRPAAGNIYTHLDLGLRLALSVIILGAGGYLLDDWLHTLPLFLVIGLLLGAVVGFVSIYRAVFPASDKDSPRR